MGDMPPLLRDVLRDAVASASDIVALDLPPEGLRRGDADVVVLGLSGEDDTEACWRLVYDSAETKVLGVQLSDGRTTCYELKPHRVSLGELSPSGFVEALRRVGRPGRAH